MNSIKDSRHRLPTLYGLYKPLLKLSPNLEISNYIKRLFKRSKQLSNLGKVQRKLMQGYQLLDDLNSLKQSNPIQIKRFDLLTKSLRITQSLLPPPTLPSVINHIKYFKSPGMIWSSPLNPPLPRLKPQPESISMMIFSRRKVIQRRWNRFNELKELELKSKDKGVVGDIRRELRELKVKFTMDSKRNNTRISPQLIKESILANIQKENHHKKLKS